MRTLEDWLHGRASTASAAESRARTVHDIRALDPDASAIIADVNDIRCLR